VFVLFQAMASLIDGPKVFKSIPDQQLCLILNNNRLQAGLQSYLGERKTAILVGTCLAPNH
jgi:hypothetical protein